MNPDLPGRQISTRACAPRPAPARIEPARSGPFPGLLLTASTVTMGWVSGLLFTFTIAVMPGLAETDDRTYVIAMQSFNDMIQGHLLFGLAFVGLVPAMATAVVLEHRRGRRSSARWVAGAAALYLVALVITVSVSIPLNQDMAAVGDPATATDLSIGSIVERFENTWIPFNIVRTLLCTAALTCLARGLVLYGRSTARG